MGDIPHGWAAAEFLLLLRDILFFEADEDHDPQIFMAAGVMPHWLASGEPVIVRNAPTLFGSPFGYELRHDPTAHKVTIEITQPPQGTVRYQYPCPMGRTLRSAKVDGVEAVVAERVVLAPAGTKHIEVEYVP